MNKRQKILTVVFLVLFALTLVWFPWRDRYDPDREYYYFLIFSYGGEADWARVGTEWFALAAIWAGLFFIVKDRRG